MYLLPLRIKSSMALVKTNAILTNHIGNSFLYYEKNVYVDVDHEGFEPSSS